MKKLLYVTAILLTVFVIGCKGVKTLSGGEDNISFLSFIYNTHSYPEGVDVTIDDKTTFVAKVNKPQFKPSRDNVYSIAPGRHTLSVKNDGTIIYKQEIFLSTQETKQITLP